MSYVILISIACYSLFVIFIISGLFKHRLLPVSSYDNLPMVSVVIAARNEEDHISNLIHDLIAQEYPIDKLEVVIINDRSTDSTIDILNDASSNYAFIKNFSIDKKSELMAPKKHALTKGIEMASGEIIILTDADCRVGKLWVSSMAYSVINQNCITIGFSEIHEKSETIFNRYQKIDFLSIIIANAGAAGWGYFWSGTGQNLAFHKKDFATINGFEKVSGRISGDDMYLVQSISKIKTGHIHIDPHSFVTTSAIKDVKGFLNQRVRWSSNAKTNYYDAPPFFGFLLIMMSFNLLILLSLFFGGPWLRLLSIKFILEGIIMFLGNKLFNNKMDYVAYCLWAILQPAYIPLIGIWGIKGKFSWKP